MAPIANLTGGPTAAIRSNSVTLSGTISGTADLVYYQYLVVKGTSTACNTTSGYSADISVVTPLTGVFSAVSDGTVTLCILGKDAAGNLQSKLAPTSVTWTKDTTPPTPTFTGIGANSSWTNASNLAVTITTTATDAVSFQYKLGGAATSSTTFCSNATGYSSDLSFGTTLTDSLVSLGETTGSGTTSGVKLCLLTKDNLGNTTALTSATIRNFGLDFTPPTIATFSGLPTNPTAASALAVTVGGTDARAGVTQYRAKLGLSSTLDCTDPTGYGTATSTGTKWTASLSGFADGDVIKLCAYAIDAAGNSQVAASSSTFSFTRYFSLLGAFTISGFTGVDDTIVDPYVTGSSMVLAFSNSTNASSYTVSIKDNTGLTTLCSQTVTSSPTDLTSNCPLSDLTNYRVYVAANYSCCGYSAPATNDGFSFWVWQNSRSVISATSPSANGTYTRGQDIFIDLTFSGPVTVTGTPTLTLNTNTLHTIDYVSGSGTSTLRFAYPIYAGETSADLNWATTSSLSLNGGSIVDSNSAAVSLTLPAAGIGTALSDVKNIVIAGGNPSAVITGAPTGTTADTDLNIQISGLGLTHFRYKIGPTSTTTCSSISGYGTDVPISTAIIQNIANLAEGSITLCVLGKDRGGTYQALASASTASWTMDTPQEINFSQFENIYTEPATGTTAVSFTVNLSKAKPYATTINFGVINRTLAGTTYAVTGTTCSGSPHLAISVTTLSIAAGATSVSKSYTLCARATVESELTYKVALFGTNQDKISIGTFSVQRNIIKDATVSSKTIAKVATGANHSCAIRTGGSLACWGNNSYGQLGDGTQIERTSSVLIDSTVTYSMIALGAKHSCGIITTGFLKCWGANTYGQLGDGTITTRLTPSPIDGTVTYQTVAIGGEQTCGITVGGVLKCWGHNDSGQLGDGSTTDSWVPKEIHQGVSYVAVSLGATHTCGITTDASANLNCWGGNALGQLGTGDTQVQLTPTPIDGAETYTKIAAGRGHTCGIASNKIKCWGSNLYGQLGDDSTTDSLLPLPIDSSSNYSGVTVGEYHTCATSATVGEVGKLYCWGDNRQGQLGDGSLIQRNLKVAVLTASATTFSTVSAGAYHSCSISSVGQLRCWGLNSGAQVGDYATGKSTSTNTALFDFLATGYDASFSNSYGSACGVDLNGLLYCWGQNSFNQLGDRSTIAKSVPTKIDINSTYSGLVGKISVGRYHTCAIDTNDALKCWGSNTYGQLGIGVGPASSSVPVTIMSGTTFQRIAVGGDHACAITGTSGSGTLYCWGRNENGQIGNNSTSDQLSPIVVGSSYSTTRGYLVAGFQHTCATNSATTITRCWGSNAFGQLGDGTLIDRLVPTATVGNTVFNGLSAGGRQTCGFKTSTNLWYCFGENVSGQSLGDGNNFYLPKYVPVVHQL